MEPGKIHLLNAGHGNDDGITQTIAVAINNRLYRVTNDGADNNGAPGLMRIRISRTILWFFTVNSVFDLEAGRSVDVYGSTLTVVALTSLQLFGSYDTI
jgi:hypothetical protein